METHEKFKAEINKKLSEVNARIVDLRGQSDENSKIKNDLFVVLKHLESIRENILLQYEKIEQTEKDSFDFPELKKNIYKSFNSFDEAFTKAGSLLEPTKFRSREHSVNFNNPTGNK